MHKTQISTLQQFWKHLEMPAAIACILCFSAPILSQVPVDTVDPDFSPPVFSDTNPIINGAVAVNNETQLVVSGQFDHIGGAPVSNIARLNMDGSVDTSFRTRVTLGLGFANNVSELVALPDGKLLIGGQFTAVNGVPRPGLARLHENGSLDMSFSPPDFKLTNAGPSNTTRIDSIALQADGKVIVAGFFNLVGQQTHQGIVRLNQNGTLDGSFSTQLGGAFAHAELVAVQNNGKILVAGFFSSVNTTMRANFARLEPNGALDSSYDVSMEGAATAIAFESDGSAIVTGFLGNVNGLIRNGAARISSAGVVDTDFNLISNGGINHVTILGDGSFLLAGDVRQIGGQNVGGFARVSSAGVVDLDSVQNYQIVTATETFSNGSTFVAGFLRNVETRENMQLLDSNYDIQFSFDPGVVEDPGGIVNNIVENGEKLIVMGSFTRVGGQARRSIVQLNQNGSVDSSFAPQPNVSIFDASVQSDDKVLVVGNFSSINGSPISRFARFHPNGDLDLDFNPGFPVFPRFVEVLPNQQSLVTGGSLIQRFNTDGTLDNNFSVTLDGNVDDLTIMPNGKIMLLGRFSMVNGEAREWIVRLMPNGALDPSFTLAEVVNTRPFSAPAVRAFAIQPDGKVIFGGSFNEVGGETIVSIARANGDGTVDSTYKVDLFNNVIEKIITLPDRSAILLGLLGTINGVERNRMGRILEDGTLAEDFSQDISGNAGASVKTGIIDRNGDLLIGGRFNAIGDVDRPGLARFGEGNPETCFVVPTTNGGLVTFCL